jgi:3-hydroxyanthranilic acid dioxygenase
MYNEGQLKVMYVAGVNQRKDYHIEEGEALFPPRQAQQSLSLILSLSVSLAKT